MSYAFDFLAKDKAAAVKHMKSLGESHPSIDATVVALVVDAIEAMPDGDCAVKASGQGHHCSRRHGSYDHTTHQIEVRPIKLIG